MTNGKAAISKLGLNKQTIYQLRWPILETWGYKRERQTRMETIYKSNQEWKLYLTVKFNQELKHISIT